MAGHFTDEFLDEVRARNDLVQIVSQYVPLQQKSRRYWGCCPFHSEKMPSFSVDPDKQFYYCFGCHEGGNVCLLYTSRLIFRPTLLRICRNRSFAAKSSVKSSCTI